MCLGIPGKIISICEPTLTESASAQVDFSGVTQNVRLDFLPEAKVGDFVLVHVGVALSVIDEEEARLTLHMLEELGSLEDELGSQFRSQFVSQEKK